jgi:branched-subunit amino acid ABC-type transport system permease component
VTASVIAIAAVGVSLVYGILGLVNFAYGDYMAFGALVAVELYGPLGPGIVPSALLAIIFRIFTATATGEVENVYTVSADGTGLTQVTHGGVRTGRPTGARIR